MHRLCVLLANTSIVVIGSAICAHAADPGTPPQESAQEDSAPQLLAQADVGLKEIIVTARRRRENLQDVPQTVQVASAQDIGKYSVLQFTDLTKLIPGLQMVVPNGFTDTVSMRGVTYNQNQAVPATVTTYLNDVVVPADLVFQSLYDIGQIEVLRGPTGTLHGDISPSGSITITTRAPDLDRIDGYVQATVGTLHDQNLQGAINLPVIDGKLAVRIAAMTNHDTVNQVDSLFSAASPHEETDAARISVRFAPTDNLDALVSYQHLWHNQVAFDQFVGSGAPGPVPPANYNGPPLTANQLLTVEPRPGTVAQRVDDFEGHLDWTFDGQKLSAVTGWNRLALVDTRGGPNYGNVIPGYTGGAVMTVSQQDVWSQELSLSSVKPLFSRLDYTAGLFFTYTQVPSGLPPSIQSPTYLPGAFGSPLGTPVVGPPNEAYVLQTTVAVPSIKRDYAGFATLTYHLTRKDDITGGVRYTVYKANYLTDINLSPGYAAAPVPVPCSFLHATSTYPGTCNFPVVVSPIRIPYTSNLHPIIYNVELAHHFTDEVMAYFRTASSWRPPNIQVGTAVGAATDPDLAPYVLPNQEKSKEYEVGLKSMFFHRRLMVNIDYYHQIFDGLIYTLAPFYYLEVSKVPNVAPIVNTQTLLTTNANAVVDGVELDASGIVLPRWTVSGHLSFADGRLSNDLIPCSPPGGTPTVATFQSLGQNIYKCRSDASTASAPHWNFTLQSEYDQPITQAVNGFVRGDVQYYGKNPYEAPPNVVPAYALVDLYIGLRQADNAWEVSLYGKNITDDSTIVNPTVAQITGIPQFFGSPGYTMIARTPQREYGMIIRYAF